MGASTPNYGSGGGAPTGAAGGDLGGTYPNPTVPGLAGKAATGTYRTTATTVQKATGTINGVIQPDGTATGNYTFTFTSAIPVANVVVRVDGFDMDQSGDLTSIATDGTTITVVMATGNAPVNEIVLKTSSVTL